MKPIGFSCEETLALPPDVIAQQILDIANWPEFKGYTIIPGIKSAEFEVRTPGIVGSKIRVTNTDGSHHLEEIVEWQPERGLKMLMTEFSNPLARLASHFEETWDFKRIGNETHVTRTFQLHAKTAWSRPLLWLISFVLKKAIARHLQQMQLKTRGLAK
jgi:hypothetical protein